MQHQELMIYDLQYYYQRFSDPEDNYKPIKKGVVVEQKSKKRLSTRKEIDSIVPSSGRYQGPEECDSNDKEGVIFSAESKDKE